jgi:hypothetical protein
MDTLFYERNDPRYEANLIIEVQLSSWNPFVHKEAKLIDFSMGGFKLEFLENFSFKNMEKIIILIPLDKFGLQKTKKLKLKADIKWYDPLHKQVGGTYASLQKQDETSLQKIISTLAKKSETEQK